jgi:hydrogenase maturation protein HypF
MHRQAILMRERRNIKIRGAVQGVFFRETVRRTASRYDICGFVRNVGSDVVEIEAEGRADALDAFIADVLAHPPRAARIDAVQSTVVPMVEERGFIVRHW